MYRKHTHTSNNNINKKIEEIVPSVLALLKMHISLGHAGIVDLSIPDFLESLKRKGQKQ